MQSVDLIWTLASFICTIFIFSFILGDNPLFRITSYLFIGVTAAFVAVILIYQVIIPKLIIPVLFNSAVGRIVSFVPLILSILLLAKLFPRYSRLGNISMGFLVGVGAAVMMGGAVKGTLIDQTTGAIAGVTGITSSHSSNISVFRIAEALTLLIGTISTLIYFQFSAKKVAGEESKRSKTIELISKIGGVFIAITFGALYVGVYSASLSALIERLDFIINTIRILVQF